MGTGRPRMLFVARATPWPLHGGARIRDFNVLQALAELFEIDLLTIGHPQAELEPLCRAQILPTPNYGDENLGLALARWSAAAWESLRGAEPLWLTSKTSGILRRTIRTVAASGDYDVIHAAELSSVATLLGYTQTPVVYDAHNCEWRLLDRTRERMRGLNRAVLSREVPLLRAVEERSVTETRAVLATAETDAQELARLGGARTVPMHVIPSPIDLQQYAPARAVEPPPLSILVPGKFDWRPNVIGLNWFLEAVLPVLRTKMGEWSFQCVVAGRMDDATAKAVGDAGATAAANPPDMVPHFAQASTIAVPVLVSSGTRLRIAEALASRRAVVTTSPGAVGLDPGALQPWLCADDAGDFADALARVMTDAALRDRVTSEGWQMAQTMDWRAAIAPLAAAYGQALGRDLARGSSR